MYTKSLRCEFQSQSITKASATTSNVVMKVIKAFKFSMICCLELTYLAILLLPLSSAVNVSDSRSAASQNWLWPTAAANITNIRSEPNYPSSPATTIIIICNVYFTLCINHYHRRNFNYNYKNAENCNDIRYRNFDLFRRLNESKSQDKELQSNGNGNSNSWSLEQQWRRKERITCSSAKGERSVSKANNQRYFDDIFEVTLFMLLAIFVEVIPLTLRYVRQRTIICWRQLQLFCCCSNWNIARTLFQRQRLHQQRGIALNCVCDVMKLALIKWKSKQDLVQKQPYTIRQNQLTVFAVITGKIFALFVQGTTSPSTDISISADARGVCTTAGKLIFLSGVPGATVAKISKNCKNTCQHFLLTTIVISPVTFTHNETILTDRVLYILIPQDNRIFRSRLALFTMIFQQLPIIDICYDCNCFNGGVCSNGKQKFSDSNRSESCCNDDRSHQKRKVFVILQPLFDHTETIPENHENKYVEVRNNSRYLKSSRKKLLKLKKYKNKAKAKLPLGHAANDFFNKTLWLFKCGQEFYNALNVAIAQKKAQTFCELFWPGAKLHSHQANTKQKSKIVKSIKSTKGAMAAEFDVSMSLSCTPVTAIKHRRTKNNNTDWKHCMHDIIKFDLCCCFWCFYCYRRYKYAFGRNFSGSCNTYWRQYAFNYPHCIYCYYYCYCYCCFNHCYGCCCWIKLQSASITCPYCQLVSRLNNQHLTRYIKLNRNTEAGSTITHLNQPKQQRVPHKLDDYRNFFQSNLKNFTYPCSDCPHLNSSGTLYRYQNLHHCCLLFTKDVTTVTATTATTENEETISKKKSNLMQYVRCGTIYLGKYLFDKLIHIADYFYRYIIAVLRVKISVPGSAAIVIKVPKEQQQQQQQQQMICIAHDQQLKMNNLCKIFCNNWKRHRRRRRRRRRRRINKQEQQQQQSVALQQQHISSEKDTVLHRLHIWDVKECKTIATNVPSVHLILSNTTPVSMLAAIRLSNHKMIALSEGTRKEMMNPPPTPTMITSPSCTASAGVARISRSRTRQNLVWLFIGLVWFEGPKYVNCSINGNNQSQQPTTQAQTQTETATHTADKAPLQPLSTPSHVCQHQRQQYQTQPTRITTSLLLLTPNHKPIIKATQTQKTTTFDDEAAMSFEYKLRYGKNTNINGKSIRSDNCLSSRRRASIIAAATNEKQTRPHNSDSIVLINRKHYDWLESEAEVDFLNEEAHNAQSDRTRLESIKRQILTKLGLKHKPNVSHPLPKQFIWDTIYRADGIHSVVSDFDFNENGSHQLEMMADADDSQEIRQHDLTKLPLRLEGTQELENTIGKKEIIGHFMNRNNGDEHNKETTRSKMPIKASNDYQSIDDMVKTANERVLARNSPSQRPVFKVYTNYRMINKSSFYEKSHNLKYKGYMQNVRFNESSKINNRKSTNNLTYLMRSRKPNLNVDILEVREAETGDVTYDNNDGDAFLHAKNLDKYNLHHLEYGISQGQNQYESEDFFGETQEIITFAEKGKMYKQHRLVEFSAQTNGVPNPKLFIRKAEIHIRIDKATIRGTENKKRKNFGCGGKKTKLKLWIFQIMENNTTKEGCDQSPQLCATFNVDTINLGWQKFDITSTIRDWYERLPMKKLRLLIDCTGCGKQYVLNLFDQPLEVSRRKQSYTHRDQDLHSVNQNDLVVQWARRRRALKNNNIIEKESDVNQGVLPGHQVTKHVSMACNSILGCNVQKNSTSVVENYKLKKIQMQLFQQYKLERNSQQQQLKNAKHRRPNRSKHPDAQYLHRQRDMHLLSPKSSLLNPNRPFLVLHTETRRLRRVRRRAIDCVGAIHGQCCKESFYVSFKALGWDDWIIAPRGYFANYCRGDCTGPFRTPDTFQTFHAHFIEEYRKIGLLNGMQPCCAPVKFSSMSLIYYGDDGIIKRDLPKMVVDECGCP
ncbi:uncharacterized protein LOC129249796 isoform X3 [Anastrepha obliqua]|uniref:uncharacterized protein LOC129249796 isoform X3 n=1 Tax=Anastrepha obliqua TaxID=95512 RepID=UPI0024096F72|nr:uncharacterized protein LOC129249796 isoform X3 [Anastrepha obliqua]